MNKVSKTIGSIVVIVGILFVVGHFTLSKKSVKVVASKKISNEKIMDMKPLIEGNLAKGYLITSMKTNVKDGNYNINVEIQNTLQNPITALDDKDITVNVNGENLSNSDVHVNIQSDNGDYMTYKTYNVNIQFSTKYKNAFVKLTNALNPDEYVS